MSNLKQFIPLLGMLMLIGACSKEEAQYLRSGTTSAELSGAEWSASNYATYSPGVDFYNVISIVRNPEGLPIRSFDIGAIPPGVDSIRIFRLPGNDSSPVALFSVLDIDLVLESFKLTDDQPNLLLIDSLNETTGYIAGRFDFLFVRAFSTNSNERLPDTLRMENGRFESRVVNF